MKGYTLIEILVGLTIIALLFGFGYVSFRDFARRQSINGFAKSVQGDLRLAQSRALSGEKPDDAFCNTPNLLNTYDFKVYSNSEYKIEVSCSGGVITEKDVNLPADILISTPSVNPIRFKVLGQGTNIDSSEDVVVILTQSGTNNIATITITAGGEIK